MNNMSYASFKKIKNTTDDIIHISSGEFHVEFNGSTPGAESLSKKKNRTKKNCKIQPKMGLKKEKKTTFDHPIS